MKIKSHRNLQIIDKISKTLDKIGIRSQPQPRRSCRVSLNDDGIKRSLRWKSSLNYTTFSIQHKLIINILWKFQWYRRHSHPHLSQHEKPPTHSAHRTAYRYWLRQLVIFPRLRSTHVESENFQSSQDGEMWDVSNKNCMGDDTTLCRTHLIWWQKKKFQAEFLDRLLVSLLQH